MAPSLESVFDPAFLRKLDRLRLTVRRTLGTRPGNTPMPRGAQPAGMELAAYKPYAAGDDLRYLDWSAYGRLDQMLVRTFRAEREAPLLVVIDRSASMGVPRADAKLPFAAALAASLAYVSLRRHDPARIVTLGGRDRAFHASPVFRHSQRLPEVRAFLAALEARGPTTLAEGIEAFLRTTRLPGVAVVLSDFLVPPPAYEAALDHLCRRGCSVAALRLIGPQERDPGSVWGRRLRLRDAESGRERVVALTGAHRVRYAAALDEHLARLRRWCESRAILFTAADTGRGVEACLFDVLPRIGLLH